MPEKVRESPICLSRLLVEILLIAAVKGVVRLTNK